MERTGDARSGGGGWCAHITGGAGLCAHMRLASSSPGGGGGAPGQSEFRLVGMAIKRRPGSAPRRQHRPNRASSPKIPSPALPPEDQPSPHPGRRALRPPERRKPDPREGIQATPRRAPAPYPTSSPRSVGQLGHVTAEIRMPEAWRFRHFHRWGGPPPCGPGADVAGPRPSSMSGRRAHRDHPRRRFSVT